MTEQLIDLASLQPDEAEHAYARRVYARRDTLDGVDRAAVAYAEAHGELLADALDKGDAVLAAVTVQTIVAHARAARARRAELRAAAGAAVQP